MATMTKADRRQQQRRHLYESVARKLAEVGRAKSMFDLSYMVADWEKKAKRLRKRWENECSYEWANTPAYEKATERAAERLRKAVTDAGLFVYLQTDPRGATLYVDSKPIPDDNYTQAICICLD